MSDRAWVLDALLRYWPRGRDAVAALAVPERRPSAGLPPRVVMVALPEWAADLAADGGLLVPEGCAGEAWAQTDWWSACAWYLDGAAERAHEAAQGPIHSYALRLRGWDGRLWDRAWVNRIALFLRRWAARAIERDEAELFGARPAAELVLSHDVDAVHKTLAIRAKQGAFQGFNAARQLASGDRAGALSRLGSAARFALSTDAYWYFDEIRALEAPLGVTSEFYFHVRQHAHWARPKLALLDPAYRVDDPRVRDVIRRLGAAGHTIGLHPSFDDWRDARPLADARQHLESVAGVPVRRVRQHWLRFSWADTWRAQAEAGFELDSTLGFNDRPGFRAGSALRYRPRLPGRPGVRLVDTMPMILMDSHVYDYRPLAEAARRAEIDRWLDELWAVGGQASLIWHQQAFGPDYAWTPGYQHVLARLAGGVRA